MPSSPPRDQTTAINGNLSIRTEINVGGTSVRDRVAFAVSVAMTGWLYILARALLDGASWLMSQHEI
jgi:hypothetical protein